MAWTDYHNWLQQEAVSIMLEPEWYENPTLVNRMNSIRGELSQAQQSLDQVPVYDEQGQLTGETQSRDEYFGNLLSQFEQARQSGQQANLDRYNQLLGDPGGIMNYQQRQDWLMNMYDQPQQGYNQLLYGQGDVNNPQGGIVGELGGVGQQFQGVANQFNQQADQIQQGFDQRAADLGGQFQSNLMNNYLPAYQQRTQDITSFLGGLGDQQRSDLADVYSQRRAQADQDMVNRGLGNTTVRNSVHGGLLEQEQDDRRRLEDQLTREKMGYMSALTGEELGAMRDVYGAVPQFLSGLTGESLATRQALAGQRAQYGLLNPQFSERALGMRGDLGQLPLAYRERVAGIAGDLSSQPLGVIERRTDTSPTLSDVANLAMSYGQGSAGGWALPQFGSPTQSQQPTFQL